MYRLHLSTDDLARIRLVPSFGQYAEALFSLGPLADGRRVDALFGGWRQRIGPASSVWAAPLLRLMGREPQLDLFTLIGRVSSVTEGTEAFLSLGRRQLRTELNAAAQWAAAAGRSNELPSWALRLPDEIEVRNAFSAMLQDCIAAAIDPHWSHIQAHLDAEATAGARTLAEGGVINLLQSLHPRIRWSDGTLIVDETSHRTHTVTANVFDAARTDVMDAASELNLHGRGITLVPSIFCRRITPYVGIVDGESTAVLFYPVLRDIGDAYRLWARGRPGSTEAALGALLGSTRAAALDSLTRPSTTTELARRLGVSLATASHHTGVLRDAGLITTRRNGGAVLHLLSPLGRALLNGEIPNGAAQPTAAQAPGDSSAQ